MAIDHLKPSDWNLIIDRILAGRCVPFLGAAVNIDSHDGTYKGLPLGGEVSLRLLEKWLNLKDVDLSQVTTVSTHETIQKSDQYSDLTRLAISNLARVSLHIEFRDDFPRLVEFLRDILPDDQRDPSPLLRTLARLPKPQASTALSFRLIVTTNYDCLMERALQEAGTEHMVVIQPKKGFKPAQTRRLQNELAVYEGVVVYKIHGSFADDPRGDSSEIIITEEDYIEFLHTVVNTQRGIPRQIHAKLVGSTLLFLGYSLEDWDFRTLFKGMIETLEDRDQVKSFAVQRRPSPFWVDFWSNKRVQIRDVDLYEFAAGLRERLKINLPPSEKNGNVPEIGP